ncbi:uncharacterized protein Pyn_30938 [Prunus yedoensis var. nudiflora]|uniref:Uncharacterized protein n=1 Tax=Prunus yedoensis var. nudiflora TaxID=2094558 RepID=A0A314UYX3_PRUYE|nr:uncharacterized protein Pyn_30938 [Prunus yedoensis var. nudiflora]
MILPIEEQGTKTYKNRPKCSGVVVRRSLRIRDHVVPTENQNMEHVIEDITDSEGESEDEQPAHKMHGSSSGKKSMEEKFDYLVQLLETMNSKVMHSSREIISFCV